MDTRTAGDVIRSAGSSNFAFAERSTSISVIDQPFARVTRTSTHFTSRALSANLLYDSSVSPSSTTFHPLFNRAVCHQPVPTANRSLDSLSPIRQTKQISIVRIGCCSSSVLCDGTPENDNPAPSLTMQFNASPTVSSSLLTSGCASVAMLSTGQLNGHVPVSSVPINANSSYSFTSNLPSCITEVVRVYRAPGERLGMALKFEGGSCAAERIERVFIQSIADHSPASRAQTDRLISLKENDELLEIDGHCVRSMSRLQCVACLRDAATSIALTVRRPSTAMGVQQFSPLISFAPVISTQAPPAVPSADAIEDGRRTIRRGKGPPPSIPPRLSTTVLTSRPPAALPTHSPPIPPSDTASQAKAPSVPRRPSQPPPLPPRKAETRMPEEPAPLIGKSDTQVPAPVTTFISVPKTEETAQTPSPQRATTCAAPQIASALTMPTAVIHQLLIEPPIADAYTDSLNSIPNYIESESDDTASTASTVIEKAFSRASTANSSFSDKDTRSLDIQNVLGPFERLEQELDSAAKVIGLLHPSNSYLSSGLWTQTVPSKAQNKSIEPEVNKPDAPTARFVNLDDYDDIQALANECEPRTSSPAHVQSPQPEVTPLSHAQQTGVAPALPSTIAAAPAEQSADELYKPDCMTSEITNTQEEESDESTPTRSHVTSECTANKPSEVKRSHSKTKLSSANKITPSSQEKLTRRITAVRSNSSSSLQCEPRVKNTHRVRRTSTAPARTVPHNSCNTSSNTQNKTTSLKVTQTLTSTRRLRRSQDCKSTPNLHRAPSVTVSRPKQSKLTRKTAEDTSPVNSIDQSHTSLIPKIANTAVSRKSRSSLSLNSDIDNRSYPPSLIPRPLSRRKIRIEDSLFELSRDNRRITRSKGGDSVANSSSSGNASNESCSTGCSSGDSTCDEHPASKEHNMLTDALLTNNKMPLSDSGRSLSSASIGELSSDGECKPLVLDFSAGLARHAQHAYPLANTKECPVNTSTSLMNENTAVNASCWPHKQCGSDGDSCSTPGELSIGEQYRVCALYSSCEFQPSKCLAELTATPSTNEEKIETDVALDACKRNFRAIVEQWKQRASECSTTQTSPTPGGAVRTRHTRSAFALDTDAESSCSGDGILSSLSSMTTVPPKLPPKPHILRTSAHRLSVDTLFDASKQTPNAPRSVSPVDPCLKAARSMSVSDICKVFESAATTRPSLVTQTTTASLVNLSISENRTDFAVNQPVSATITRPVETLPVGLVQQRKLALITRTQEPTETAKNEKVAEELVPKVSVKSDEESVQSEWTPSQIAAMVEQARLSIEEEPSNVSNALLNVIVMRRECVRTGSIGITLAGGADYENKEITVHKIINGSLAHRDGRLMKGDRILSINGHLLKGVTHKRALEIMKSPRPDIAIISIRGNVITAAERRAERNSTSLDNSVSSAVPLNEECVDNLEREHGLAGLMDNYRIYKANLVKDGAALGFILEGGKDSPLGDRPLAIKRIFKGGPADKEATLLAGDEIICVNNVAVYCMTRTEAWNYLKKLPDGIVSMVVRRKNFVMD